MKLFNLDLDGKNLPLYPQKHPVRLVTDPFALEIFGDEEDLLAAFGKEGVVIYNPLAVSGKGGWSMYLLNMPGRPSLAGWDQFVKLAKDLFNADVTEQHCPMFLKKELMDRQLENVTE